MNGWCPNKGGKTRGLGKDPFMLKESDSKFTSPVLGIGERKLFCLSDRENGSEMGNNSPFKCKRIQREWKAEVV